MDREATFQAIAADLELCEIGIALTKGATRRKYIAHRKACIEEIKRLNREDGLDEMSIEETLAELAD